MRRCVLFISVVCLLQLCVHGLNKMQIPNPRVCVIGAGISGLTSARYLKEENINFTVLEATKYIGGTWRYDPRVGTDEYGQPLYTSMYKYLRTNLAKPAMELRDFPVPNDWPSFPIWSKYYDYLKAYTQHFELEKRIQFLQLVTAVRRVGSVWKVKHKYVPTNEEFEDEYDFVFIGTGHFSKPSYPNITGEGIFKGAIIHSHDYRVPDPFTCRRVLVVGAGPSGMDITIAVADVSKKLVHSHHSKVAFKTKFPMNYSKKPDIKELNETGALFVDGTYEDVDDIIYCTGYEYYYPFLNENSELNLNARSVTPLYRYMVNVNQPTMILIGLVVRACIFIAIDAQSQYATALVKGNFTLPPKQEMMAEVQRRADAILSKGRPLSDIHLLGDYESQYATALVKGNFTLPPKQEMMAEVQRRADAILSKGRPLSDIHLLGDYEDQYYADLTKESGIERVPPVMHKIRNTNVMSIIEDLYTYRYYNYTIIDSETFTRNLEEEPPIHYNSCKS